MRMLRVAMRHTIELGGSRQAIALCTVGLAMIAVGSVCRAEGWASPLILQSGSLSGGDARMASPKGIPPHAPGYLGILFADLTEEQAAALHYKGVSAVEVVNVDHDGPAGKAGLQAHDVIVKLNGQVVGNAETLKRMIHDAGVGAGVSLVVFRGGKQVVVNAQLAYRGEVEREAMARMVLPNLPPGDDSVVTRLSETYEIDPEPAAGAGKSPGFLAQMLHSTPFTGMMVEAVAPQLAGFFGSSTGGGLLVETVEAGGPAAAAGLRAGDVIERADSIAVKSPSEWVKRLHASKGQAISLIVLRDRREITMTLIPQAKKHSKLEWPMMPSTAAVAA